MRKKSQKTKQNIKEAMFSPSQCVSENTQCLMLEGLASWSKVVVYHHQVAFCQSLTT